MWRNRQAGRQRVAGTRQILTPQNWGGVNPRSGNLKTLTRVATGKSDAKLTH